ncbi:MAG: hypothetical protein IJ214_05415 [Clostridia bacterium]|nr:hypothetical protein [Clostridia bacterium]
MAYFSGIQYATNATVVANPGRRESGCDIEIQYVNDQGATRNVILRVTDSTVLRGADGRRVSCASFTAGQRVNASFTDSMSNTAPPMARAYSITRQGTGSGTVGIDIDL